MTKAEQLAQLESSKQALLEGMGHSASYPDMPESYADHMRDVTPEQDDASLRQVRPLDPNPYAPRDHDGVMTMSDAAPSYPRSAYPEQDSQAAQIAALQRRLAALQGR